MASPMHFNRIRLLVIDNNNNNKINVDQIVVNYGERETHCIWLIIIFRCYDLTSLSFTWNPLLKIPMKWILFHFILFRWVFFFAHSLIPQTAVTVGPNLICKTFSIALFKFRIYIHIFFSLKKYPIANCCIFDSCYFDCVHKKEKKEISFISDHFRLIVRCVPCHIYRGESQWKCRHSYCASKFHLYCYIHTTLEMWRLFDINC